MPLIGGLKSYIAHITHVKTKQNGGKHIPSLDYSANWQKPLTPHLLLRYCSNSDNIVK